MQKATGEYLTDSVSYLAFIATANEPIEAIEFTQPDMMENKGFDYYLRTIQLKVNDKLSYNWYWKEMSEQLSGYEKIYLSADGVFNGINLGALKNPDTDQYLYEEHTIIQLSSLRDLANRAEKQAIEANEAVFVGRPQYYLGVDGEVSDDRGESIADLPGTEKEITEITNQLVSQDLTFKNYIGEKALEGMVKQLNSPAILHIATHGYFDEDQVTEGQFSSPLLSAGLLLSGAGERMDAEGQDGILTAYEITGINLTDTDLVVLSACESGIGEHRDGQGIYGLSRAFFVAGAETVIASLWKGDDTATQKFMSLFYENWLQTNDVAASMSYARTALKEEYPAPYYWAAFVATGL